MAVARHGLPEGPSELVWTAPSATARTRAAFIGLGVALCAHLALGMALARLDLSELFRRDAPVEFDVNEPPPPPPEVKPEPPPPPPPPPEPKPRLVMHRAPAAPPPEAPPPPNQTPPPKAAEAPPVFGVTMDSVVTGDGPGMAVPVGNTLMTKERVRAKPEEVKPVAGEPDRLPTPVPEMYVAEQPRVIKEVRAEYPPDAQRMGIEGVVEAKLLLDENGNVRSVRLTRKAGHGFDERAVDALKKTKFSPARTADGKAVPYSLTYVYRFEHAE